jgi:prepilin-type N-terminal cleavage/methylation domain-containing protein
MVRREPPRGFTLIEVMVVVVIIGVLAMIAVPALTSTSNRSKATTEVTAFFTALATAQAQYKLDKGTYLTTAACPAAPSVPAQAVTCGELGNAWCTTAGTCLRVSTPSSTAFCSYQVVTGTTTGTNNPNGFVFQSPNAAWYYILATCDMNEDGVTFSRYFTSSVDSSIQTQNEGE